MELTLNQKIIGNDLSIVHSICTKLHTESSANLCLIELLEKEASSVLRLTATDFDFLYEREIQVQGSGSGKLCVPPGKLMNFIHSMNGEDVLLSAYATVANQLNALKLTAKGYEVKILGSSADTFPQVTQDNYPLRLRMKAGELSEIIKSISFCILEQGLRRNLAGMNVNLHQGDWYFVGSDSHRIGLVQKKAVQQADDQSKNNLLIPKKGIQEIEKILDPLTAEEEVDISFDDHVFQIKTQQSRFRTLLINEEYPNITNFYAFTNPVQMVVDVSVIHEVLKVFRNSMEKGYTNLYIKLQQDQLHFHYETDQSAISKEVDCQYNGPQMNLAFNLTYLIEAMNTFSPKDQIHWEIKDNASPVKFFVSTKQEYRHILMPLRT